MIDNVLFIIPPYFNAQEMIEKSNSFFYPCFTIPYGVLSIASYVDFYTTRNISMRILDLNLILYNKIINGYSGEVDKIIEESILGAVNKETDLVGISALFNSTFHVSGFISNIVKDKNRDLICIVGGGVGTNLYSRLLREFKSIDATCFAEGEIPILNLINSSDFHRTIYEDASFMTVKKVNGSITPVPSYVSNLDLIPRLRYDLINLDNYNGRSTDRVCRNESTKREMTIHTSRGCPFNCVFCANSSVHGKKIRMMSESRVMNDIDDMINRYGMNVLLIEDDHFFSNKKRAIRILEFLRNKKIRVEFPNGVSVHSIDSDVVCQLRKTGVKTVYLAVESCCDYVLKSIIDKPHTVNQIRSATKLLNDNKIAIRAFIVMGLPGETIEHRLETIRVIRELNFEWVNFSIATPISGSRLYDICVSNNYLDGEDFYRHTVTKCCIRAPGIEPRLIEEEIYLYNLDINFLNNSYFLSGEYERALSLFGRISEKYPNHAIAHYMLIKIYGLMGDVSSSKNHEELFNFIIRSDEKWASYAKKLGITG